MSSLGIVAYLALFATAGLLFVFASLLVGRFFRPSNPSAVKRATYECGEPAIGSSYVQFDLRFYVVALLFIIFDVEVAFFFPWATVFGKATNLADERLQVVAAMPDGSAKLTRDAVLLYEELGVRNAELSGAAGLADPETATERIRQGARQLAWLTIVDICLFFAILLVGFAYVWKRGDLDWVRAVSAQPAEPGIGAGGEGTIAIPPGPPA